MITFYIAAAALAVAALALLLRPWWRAGRRIASADFSPALNTAIHRDRLSELEQDRSNGTLSAADLAVAQEELQRQLLDDAAATEVVVADGFSRRSAIVIAILLPVIAVAVYAMLGSPSAVLSTEVQTQRAAADMEQLTAKLANKLEQNPDNPEGWVMLARSYKSLGRWDDAERAYARVGPGFEKNAELLAELAELLVQKNEGFTERPRQLIRQALQLEPNNMLALFLGGGDAFNSERYADAATLWERLLPQLEPGGEDARMVESGIATARERSGSARAGGSAARKDVSAQAAEKNKPAPTTGSSVSGRVELAPALKDKAKPDDVVFIFARAIDGPRMPLAAKRVHVADLPLDFMLDDSQALMPEANISSVERLQVEVRVSKTGKATPGKGDLTGKRAAVKPGAKGLRIVIDTIDP
ncbi:MAG: c-type cytochrome biogenesis protein CcmI [Burkholderiaceae bacterium]|nr:c-type cytochrome biogenesis protein CcmI [Burkholderiaceae bacterium]